MQKLHADLVALVGQILAMRALLVLVHTRGHGDRAGEPDRNLHL